MYFFLDGNLFLHKKKLPCSFMAKKKNLILKTLLKKMPRPLSCFHSYNKEGCWKCLDENGCEHDVKLCDVCIIKRNKLHMEYHMDKLYKSNWVCRHGKRGYECTICKRMYGNYVTKHIPNRVPLVFITDFLSICCDHGIVRSLYKCDKCDHIEDGKNDCTFSKSQTKKSKVDIMRPEFFKDKKTVLGKRKRKNDETLKNKKRKIEKSSSLENLFNYVKIKLFHNKLFFW